MKNKKVEDGEACAGDAADVRPVVSIITIAFNCLEDLEKTFWSVVDQSTESIEYIVIDGGSTDGTLEFLKAHDDYLTHWVSEKDRGIYDAMNKGCRLARGEGVLFLNAGDYFVGSVIDNRLPIPTFLPVKVCPSKRPSYFLKPGDARQGMPYCHQGIVFENKGIEYSLEYSISSDYEYFLRNEGKKIVNIYQSSGWVSYNDNGVSSRKYFERDWETLGIIKKYFGSFWATVFGVKSVTKSFIKKLHPRW